MSSRSRSNETTAPLFHGPDAHCRAVSRATDELRLIREFGPIADERGIRISTFREVIPFLGSIVAGDVRGSIVVGPIDVVSQPGSEDVLLKGLEEIRSETTLPVLWAWDLGSVRGTIKSRCQAVWCPGLTKVDSEADDIAATILSASLLGNVPGVIEAMVPVRPPKWKDVGADVVEALVVRLGRMRGKEHLPVWDRMRIALRRGTVPTYVEILTAVLP